MRFLWSRIECEAAVGSNVRSVPFWNVLMNGDFQGYFELLVARAIFVQWGTCFRLLLLSKRSIVSMVISHFCVR